MWRYIRLLGTDQDRFWANSFSSFPSWIVSVSVLRKTTPSFRSSPAVVLFPLLPQNHASPRSIHLCSPGHHGHQTPDDDLWKRTTPEHCRTPQLQTQRLTYLQTTHLTNRSVNWSKSVNRCQSKSARVSQLLNVWLIDLFVVVSKSIIKVSHWDEVSLKVSQWVKGSHWVKGNQSLS